MEGYGVRGAIQDLIEELTPGLRSKSLRDEESAKKQKSILLAGRSSQDSRCGILARIGAEN